MTSRCAAPLFVALLVLLATPTLAADLPPHTVLRLSYEGGGIKGCPDEQMFRDVIRAHTSYDPFSPDAEMRLVVTVLRAGRRYRGRAELRDATGAVLWPRELPPFADCYTVVEGLGFAVSIKLDPVGRTEPKPAAALEEPKPAKPRHFRTDEREPMLATQTGRPWISTGAAMVLGLGMAPRPAAGIAIDVGLRPPNWPEALWVALEARIFPPAEGEADRGPTTVRISQVTVAAVPCGHWRFLFGCGVAEIGNLSGTSDAAHPQTAKLFHLALGMRVGAEWPAVDHLAVRVSGDAILAPIRQELRIEGYPQWVTPVFTGALQAGLVASF